MMTYFKTDPARYMAISIAMLFAGMLFYGFYHKLIIIRMPYSRTGMPFEHRAYRRQTRLWYWNDERFVSEDKELIFQADIQATLTDLVATWLTLLEEEKVLSKKVAVRSVMLDPHKKTAFISFDRSPFKKAQSTYSKLVFIEGLLRSLKESLIPISKVQFLAEHQPIVDRHLDFSHPWTINGYLT